jgi:hypothetical protein
MTCHFRLDGPVYPACTELLADNSGLLAGTGVAFRLGGVEEALAWPGAKWLGGPTADILRQRVNEPQSLCRMNGKILGLPCYLFVDRMFPGAI